MAATSELSSVSELDKKDKMSETPLPNGFAKEEKSISEGPTNSHENSSKTESSSIKPKVNQSEDQTKLPQKVQRRPSRRSRSKSGTSDDDEIKKSKDAVSHSEKSAEVDHKSPECFQEKDASKTNDELTKENKDEISPDGSENMETEKESSKKSSVANKSASTEASKQQFTGSVLSKLTDSERSSYNEVMQSETIDNSESNTDESEDFKGFDDLSQIQTGRLCYKFLEVVDPYITRPDSKKSPKGENENGSPSMFKPIVKLENLPSKVSSPRLRKSTLPKENLLKPFEFGWVREMVYRSTTTGVKTNVDTYYYSPSNKKFRSVKEIADYLSDINSKELTVENFTFGKESLGLDDPSKEIIRQSKLSKSSLAVVSKNGSPTARKAMPKAKGSASKSTSSGSVSTGPEPSSPQSSGNTSTPRVTFKSSTVSKKVPAKRGSVKAAKKRRSAGPEDSMLLDESEWNPEQKPQGGAREVCSIECRLAMGLIPTLQCVACLCLYHPECVSLPQAKHRQIHSYVCKACQEAKASKPPVLPPPPPLTPINQQTPPKDKKDTKVLSTKPIVGAVTTWLPPSTNIHVGGTLSGIGPKQKLDACPQSLISVQGKKFIFVPNSNHSLTVTGREEGAASANNQTSPVLLVPYSGTATPTSHGTFVVQSANESSTYIVTSPPNSTPSSQLTNGVKRPAVDSESSSPPQKLAKVSTPPKGKSPTPSSSPAVDGSPVPVPALPAQPAFQPNYWSVICSGYSALFHAFQYLKVHELLRAACVNRMWRHLASHPLLWEHVRMKNTRVHDWKGFGKTLRERSTRTLDLRKMLVPESTEATLEMWKGLTSALSEIPTIHKVDLGRCIPEAIDMVVTACPQLEGLVALTIRGQCLDASCLKDLKNLQELKLKSVGNIEIINLKELKNLTKLKHLAITTAKRLVGIEDVLPESLESLELGECSELGEVVATTALPRLVNLCRLRLEKGQGPTCPTIQILSAVAGLPNLKQLELINFDVKPGFEKALAQCVNLRTLLIIPTYVTQSATTNHVVMGGVSKLANTLTYFIWGLTLELLRVTDLFIDQVEAQKTKSVKTKKGSGDSIPILKPLSEEPQEPNKATGQTTSQVDILALPKLQKVLSTLLPTTKIKILKVPFSATWRQTVDL